jgi:apoptosis-inducing factor 2
MLWRCCGATHAAAMGNAASADGGTSPTKPRVVILGGGYAGLSVAHALVGKPIDVTLLDPRGTFSHVLGYTRALAQPGFEHGLFIPRDRMLAGCRLVVGTASAVDAAARTVAYTAPDGGAPSSLPYDVLVVATGVHYASPGFGVGGSTADAKRAFRDIRAAIGAAKSIVVVGGGAVGSESAGEIAGGYPGKSITLVHSGAHLVSGKESGPAGADPAIGGAVESRLVGLGVTVIKGDKVVPLAEGDAAKLTPVAPHVLAGSCTLATAGGRSLPADLQIWTTGGTAPNTGFLRDSPGGLGAAVLNARGEVRVDAFGRVEGQPAIFAVGDVADSGHPKMAIVIERGIAPTVAANVAAAARAVAAGKDLGDAAAVGLAPVPAPWTSTAIIVVLSPRVGFGKFGPAWLPDAIVSMTKGRDKLVGRQLGRMGYALPELSKDDGPA